MIIDEINRGQTPRIFGELIHALEYRGEPIKLLYSDSDFTVPKNLILIGTMNSTDRSIAFLDYAIRRRFSFHKLEASEIVLAKYFQRYKPVISSKYVIDIIHTG